MAQWAASYREWGNTKLTSILRLQQMPDSQQSVQIMTTLLVQHVNRTLSIAQSESGTHVRRPILLLYPWHTPLNQERMGHVCMHFHKLLIMAHGTSDYSELLIGSTTCILK